MTVRRRQTKSELRLRRAGGMRRRGDRKPRPNAIVDCGWGRVLFAQTFDHPADIIEALRAEARDQRDIVMYVTDPHVLIAGAPNELFLDPSHTYRLHLATYRPASRTPVGFAVRRMGGELDVEAINRLYGLHRMVQLRPGFDAAADASGSLTLYVAEDLETQEIIGSVTGINHLRAFDDPERGCSLWCLAVDSQTGHAGVGEELVRRLAEHYIARGLEYLDLSVLHDNEGAIGLYEKLGFVRVPLFAVKRKNPINERLFTGPDPAQDMNPYARIIVDEARRRGIGVEVIDAAGALFELSSGGRTIRCRESLSDLTSAVSCAICDDKALTRRLVSAAGIRVTDQADADDGEAIAALLARRGSVVVKPARGEQGRGVAVDLDSADAVREAIANARAVCDRVIVESYHEGVDLRLVIIDFRLVAAAVRRPAEVTGNGRDAVRTLIERQSRRRSTVTGGESAIPLDAETRRCVARAGLGLDEVLEEGRTIRVRGAANLHTGDTIHDCTPTVHPKLVEAGETIARLIDIPVVGVDLIVGDPTGPDYVFIEANERPGLANHEPQPTAQRFIDLLFPLSMPEAAREAATARRRRKNGARED